MTVQTLNEDQMLTSMYAAIHSGDALELSKLMSDEHTVLKSSPLDGESEVTPIETPDKVEEVAEKTVDEPAAKDGGKTTTEATDKANDGLPDWVSALPEELKEKVLNDFNSLAAKAQSLEHYQKSNEGRVSVLHKKVDTLQRELESRKSAPPQTTAVASAPLKLEDDEALAKLKQDDPALYEIHKKREEAVLNEAQKLVDKARAEFTSTLEKQLAPVHKQREEAYIREQQEYILSVVPNAREVVNTDHWKYFETNATPAVKELIDSTDGEKVVLALQLYDQWLRAQYPEPVVTKETQPTPAQVAQAADNKKIEEERQRRLQAGAVTQKGQVTPNQIADPDAALEEMFQKIFKEKGFDRFNSGKNK